MLPEALHAEVMRNMISVNQYPQPTQDLENHFPTYWKYWIAYSYSWDLEEDIPRFMHNHMADMYTNRIIRGLKEFDAANGTSHLEW